MAECTTQSSDSVPEIKAHPERQEDANEDSRYGWVIILSTFVINFFALGIESTWGIYQDYYLSMGFSGFSSNLELAWIGAIQAVGLSIFGILAGYMSERLGHRTTGFIGTTAIALSLLTASFSTHKWHLYLNQGLLFGLGSALMVLPALTVPSQWFVKRRGLTTGISVSGYGVGGLVLSPITRKLIDEVGLRWTLRIMAISTLVLCISAFAFLKPKPVMNPSASPAAKTSLSQLSKDKLFYAAWIFMFFQSFGYYIPTFYNPEYARIRLRRNGTDSALTLAIQAGTSAIGRVLAGWVSDLIGPVNALTLCQVFSGIAQMAYWPFCTSFASLSGFAAVYGFFSGGIVSISPVFVAEIYGFEKLPSIFGLILSGTIPGTIASPSIGGAIIDRNTAPDGSVDFLPVQLYGGSWLIAGATVTALVSVGRRFNYVPQ